MTFSPGRQYTGTDDFDVQVIDTWGAWGNVTISCCIGVGPPSCTDGDGDTYSVEGGGCGEVDCDDADPLVYPGATEVCTDTIDNDCDTLIDDLDPDCGPPACNGNGVCDPGEDCELCSGECAGVTGGKPSNRYCCGNGVAEGPEGDGTICDGNY